MKTKVYLGISIRIIALFTVGMLMSFIPENLREFFGDTPHICKAGFCNHGFRIDEWYDWGARHYWYFWMMIFLFLLSLANVIFGSIKLIEKHHPEIS